MKGEFLDLKLLGPQEILPLIKEISKAKGACATTQESCAQAGVAADAMISVAFLQRITPYACMATSIPKVDFQPVEMTTGKGWFVRVMLPRGEPPRLGGFRTEDEAIEWIKNNSGTWLREHYGYLYHGPVASTTRLQQPSRGGSTVWSLCRRHLGCHRRCFEDTSNWECTQADKDRASAVLPHSN
jgi:hypothetical protein